MSTPHSFLLLLASKLKRFCEQIVARQIRVENAVKVLCLSDTHNTPLLKQQAITSICNHLAEIDMNVGTTPQISSTCI